MFDLIIKEDVNETELTNILIDSDYDVGFSESGRRVFFTNSGRTFTYMVSAETSKISVYTLLPLDEMVYPGLNKVIDFCISAPNPNFSAYYSSPGMLAMNASISYQHGLMVDHFVELIASLDRLAGFVQKHIAMVEYGHDMTDLSFAK